MGIFSRKNKKENKEIQRDLTQEGQFTKDSFGNFTYSPAGRTFNLNIFNEDPETLAAFFGGIELISNSIASVPIYVKQFSDEEVVKNHPVSLALRYGRITKFNFIKQLIHDVYLTGNAIAYIKREISGDVKELIYCPIGTYSIYYDELKNEVFYKIPRITGDKLLDYSQVVHIFKNSKNGKTGIGLPYYARIVLPLSSAADKSALEFYDSGGNINGILQGKRILDTEEKMEAYNEWTNAFRGGNKNGNIAVIGNDFEYKQVGISQKDAQALETRQFNVLEICRYLNISPILLGINTGTTYNNIEQAQMDMVVHTLLPLINLIEEEFNRKFIRPSQRDRYYIDFDEDKIMFSTKGDTANYLTTLTKNGIISVNESRKVLGFSPRPDCDELFIPYTNLNNNKVNGAENNDGKEEKEEKNTEKEDE